MTQFRYKAFISYSHADEPWAKWLHRSLESYRVPKKLVGTDVAHGKVPGRIRPVFRDRDDLSSASDLSQSVTQALAESENLVVICSPASAESRWVKEEIRAFTRLGKKDRIFCIVVDGEADESGSIAAVFPDAIAEAGLKEPLAADARKWADGKHLAKLKLVAGMLGVPLDHLRQRDLQKRRKRWAGLTLASVVLLFSAYFAVTSSMTAQQRRDSGETLVSSKLNELRTMLSDAGEPEDLQRLDTWDRTRLSELVTSAGTTKENLVSTALSLREEAIVVWDDGELNRALDKFDESWALLATAYEADRDDQQTFFELGQANYWIGEVYLNRGELDLAESEFLLYAEITRRLIQLQPKNAEWVLEMGYALTNLGSVQLASKELNPDRILQYMQSALEYNHIALVLDPESDYYRSELGQSHAFLADAQRGVCDLDGALESRIEQVAIETSLLRNAKDVQERQEDLAWALTGLGRVQTMSGDNDRAKENYLNAIDLIRSSNSENMGPRAIRELAMRQSLVMWLDAVNGRIDEAWERSNALWDDWQYLSEETGLVSLTTLIDYSFFLLDRAWLLNQRGDNALASVFLMKGLDALAAEALRHPDNRDIGNALTYGAYRFWEIRNEQPSEEILSQLPDYRAYNGRTRACADASMAVSKAVMLGNPAEAVDLVEYLVGQGYRESGFMQICQQYFDCSVQ